MKKITTILFLIITVFCNAQVSVSKTMSKKDIKVSTTNCYIYSDTDTYEYFLVVLSTHENERNLRQLKIKLGNNKNEAIESIKRIEQMYEDATRFGCDEFSINEYNCRIKKGFLVGVVYFPQYEYENPLFDGVFRIWSYFGKLRIYTLAMDKYDEGEF